MNNSDGHASTPIGDHTNNMSVSLEAPDVESAFQLLVNNYIDALVDPRDGSVLLLRQAQEALQASEQQFRAIFESALDAILIADDKGVYLTANPAACELFGLLVDQLLGKSAVDFSVPGYDAAAGWQKFVSQQKLQRGAYRLRRADGEIRETEYAAISHFVPGRHLVILRDVTERNASERALQRFVQTQRGILDALPANIALLDEQGVILAVNEAWQTFAHTNGLAHTEAGLGVNYLALCDAVEGPDRADAVCAAQGIRRVLTGELASFTMEYPMDSPEAKRWFQLMVSPLHPGDPAGVVVMHIDISERKQNELTLRHLNTQLAVRNYELSVQIEERERVETELGNTLMLLRERIKEQALLHQVARLLHGEHASLQALVQQMVELLPVAWRYPSVAAARIRINKWTAQTDNFVETPWRQEATFQTEHGSTGTIEIVYLEECPPADEGPFLAEERQVLDSLAEMLGNYFNIHESQAQLAAVVETALDAIIIVNSARQIVLFNPAAERLSGYAAADLIGQPLDVLLPEGYRDAFRGYRYPFDSLGSLSHYLNHSPHPFYIRRANGEEFPIEASLSRAKVSGQALYTVILRDITDRQRREQERMVIASMATALRSAQTRPEIEEIVVDELQKLFRAEAVVLALRDPMTGETVFERTRGELSLLQGYRLPPGAGISGHVIRTGQIYQTDDVLLDPHFFGGDQVQRIRHLTCIPLTVRGETIGAIWLGRPTPLTADDVQCLQTVSDIAANAIHRSLLYEQLQEQAEQVQHLMETMDDGLVLLDRERRVQLSNPAGVTYLAKLAGVGVGRHLTHLGSTSIDAILASSAQDQIAQEIRWGESPDIYEVVARPLGQALDTGWVLVLRDVTAERSRQQWAAQQEQLAAIGQLAAGVAHDFNNILSAIILYTQVLQSRLLLVGQDRERLDTIQRQAQHAVNLVRQLLDFSRRSVLERSDINVVPFCKEFVKLLERILPETIYLDFIYEDNELLIHADPTRLQQALLNLVVNARDAMDNHGRLTLTLDRVNVAPDSVPPVPEMPSGRWLRLQIADTGEGIPADRLHRIFEPFFTTKEPGKGTGLGLAQVYGIVKQHDGYIDVKSNPHISTTFILYLPLLTQTEEPAPHTYAENSESHLKFSILIVEDNESMRLGLADSLTIRGHRVLLAAHGAEALAIFAQESEQIDLVLSDMIMPGMGGLELFHLLKQRQPEIKMILMTGYPLEEEGRAQLAHGGIPWLQKPFELTTLLEMVREMILSP